MFSPKRRKEKYAVAINWPATQTTKRSTIVWRLPVNGLRLTTYSVSRNGGSSRKRTTAIRIFSSPTNSYKYKNEFVGVDSCHCVTRSCPKRKWKRLSPFMIHHAHLFFFPYYVGVDHEWSAARESRFTVSQSFSFYFLGSDSRPAFGCRSAVD